MITALLFMLLDPPTSEANKSKILAAVGSVKQPMAIAGYVDTIYFEECKENEIVKSHRMLVNIRETLY
jgi:hypothetical protein